MLRMFLIFKREILSKFISYLLQKFQLYRVGLNRFFQQSYLTKKLTKMCVMFLFKYVKKYYLFVTCWKNIIYFLTSIKKHFVKLKNTMCFLFALNVISLPISGAKFIFKNIIISRLVFSSARWIYQRMVTWIGSTLLGQNLPFAEQRNFQELQLLSCRMCNQQTH